MEFERASGPGGREVSEERRIAGVGGMRDAAAGHPAAQGRAAVRLLRAGVHGGPSGSGDVRVRQRDQARMLVAGHGRIAAEYFDAGQSRVLPWARRPQAAALLAAVADPDRGFDAIVVGEYERTFYGSQYALMAPLFEHCGVQLWTPEGGGRIDFQAEDHDQLMLALGWQSKREITRSPPAGSAPPDAPACAPAQPRATPGGPGRESSAHRCRARRFRSAGE
jgi:hypothetical protein